MLMLGVPQPKSPRALPSRQPKQPGEKRRGIVEFVCRSFMHACHDNAGMDYLKVGG